MPQTAQRRSETVRIFVKNGFRSSESDREVFTCYSLKIKQPKKHFRDHMCREEIWQRVGLKESSQQRVFNPLFYLDLVQIWNTVLD